MSWHNSAILVHTDFSADPPAFFALLGLNNPQRKPELDGSLNSGSEMFSQGLGLTVCEGWTCVFGAEVGLAIDQCLPELAARTDLLAWEIEGSCGAGTYQWWQAGIKRRHWLETEGEILEDFGPPLFPGDELTPQEMDYDARVFRAMAAVSLPLETLLDRPLDAYVFPRPQSGFRNWLRRWFGI